MKLRFFSIAIAALACAWPISQVMAGAKSTTSTVVVNTVDSRASGSLGLVRNTADTVQVIGCVVEGVRGTGAGVAGTLSTHCYATDANGTSRNCISTDPELAAAALAVKSDSFVEFHWNGSVNTCVRIIANNDSLFRPKR